MDLNGKKPSGNDCYIANWKMAIETVDFPLMVMFDSYVDMENRWCLI